MCRTIHHISRLLPHLFSDTRVGSAACTGAKTAVLHREAERLAMQSSGWAPPPSQVRLWRAVRLALHLSHTARVGAGGGAAKLGTGALACWPGERSSSRFRALRHSAESTLHASPRITGSRRAHTAIRKRTDVWGTRRRCVLVPMRHSGR